MFLRADVVELAVDDGGCGGGGRGSRRSNVCSSGSVLLKQGGIRAPQLELVPGDFCTHHDRRFGEGEDGAELGGGLEAAVEEVGAGLGGGGWFGGEGVGGVGGGHCFGDWRGDIGVSLDGGSGRWRDGCGDGVVLWKGWWGRKGDGHFYD